MRVLLSLMFLWVGQMALAQNALETLTTGRCAINERSVILFAGDDALTTAALDAGQNFDRQRARIRPVARPGADQAEALCRDGRFDARDVTTAALSGALRAWPVIVLVAPSETAPVHVFALVPELLPWAGSPFVGVGRLDWQAPSTVAGQGDTPAALAPLMAAAEDTALALQFFAAGDMDAAVRMRPAPADVSALARAWLSGIPTALSSSSGLFGNRADAFDQPPSRGGQRSLDLLRDVASGAISPASAMQLSVPAFDVICHWGATENATEVRWASFVAGFWQAMRDGDDVIDPAAPLAALGVVLSRNWSCFANPVASLIERLDPSADAAALTERLAGVVRSTMASSPGSAAQRGQLATDMLATYAGVSALAFDARDSETALPLIEPTATLWLGQCTGPQQVPPTPVHALWAETAPPAGSPLSLVHGLIQMADDGPAGPFDFDARAQTADWAKATPKVGRTLRSALTADNAALAQQVQDWFDPDAQDEVAAAVRLLIFAEDADFAEERPQLIATYFGFDGESALARELLRQTLRSAALGFDERGDVFAFQSLPYQRAYRRLVDMVPWITSDGQLDDLYGGSYLDAIKVAEIDLLNLVYSLHFDAPVDWDSAFADIAIDWDRLVVPPANRNPWLLFAPDQNRLPDIPIPAVDGDASLGALSVAVSAAVHQGLAIVQNGTPTAQINTDRLAAIASVGVDAAYRAVSARHTARATYLPSAHTGQMFDAMRAAAGDMVHGDDNPLVRWASDGATSLQEVLEGALFVWNGGIGAYLIGEWSTDSDSAVIAARVKDSELLARSVLAFLAPLEFDGDAVAADIDKHLRDGVDWPPAVQRIAARLALDLLEPDGLDPAQNRAALLADIDAVISVEARQKLLDAGFIQAAGFGLPLRILLASKDAGGQSNLSPAQIEHALRQELARFSFDTAFRHGPWRDVGGAFAALSAAIDGEDGPFDDRAGIISRLASEDYADLRRYGASIFPALDPSLEAVTLAQFMVLSTTETPTDTLNVDTLLDNCPQLAATLLAWKVHQTDYLGDPVAVADAQDMLDRIVEAGDQFRTIYHVSDLDLSPVSLRFRFAQGIPLFASDQTTGGISLKGQTVATLDAPWRVETQTGVAATEYDGSPAFAAVLHLAEQIATRPGPDTADLLAPVLVQLETIAFGGSRNAGADWPLAPHRAERPLPDVLGAPLPPPYALINRIGTLPQADVRLFRLAAQAEALGLNALARRTAGIAMAFDLERFEVIRDAERAAEAGLDEDLSPPTEQDRLRALIVGEQSFGGLVSARVLGSGLYDLPATWIEGFLCPDGGDACPPLPRFAVRIDDAQVWDDDRLPLCERVARAVLRTDEVPFAPEDMADCMHGPLGMDVQLARSARPPDPALFARSVQAGFLPLPTIFDADRLTQMSLWVAAQIPQTERDDHFAATARQAVLLQEPESVLRFAILRTLAQIADPARDALSPTTKAELQDLLDVVGPLANPDDVAYLDAILNSGPQITANDRAQAGQILGRFLGENQ